jgi:hypothetical protein
MKERKIITWKFVLGNGKQVTVDYCPGWTEAIIEHMNKRVDHFEFHGEKVSPTGYRSDFMYSDPSGTEQEAYELAKDRIVELTGIGYEDWQGQLELF